jgi:capsular polysaccharide biosynthesis protein
MKDSENSTTGDFSIANTLVNDYMELVTMRRVINQVCHDTGLILSPEAFRKMVSVTSIESTRFVHVSVTAADPNRACELANSLASNACSILNDDLLNGQPYASVANEGIPPSAPSNPISMLKLLIFAFLGAIAVYGVYFVLFLLDDKVNNADDVEKYLGLSVLGQIPNKQDVSRRKKGYYAYSRSFDQKS